MLKELRLKNFKSFVDESVQISPFTLLIGINASGKSNFFDAIRFLQGLALGYSISEILSGRYEGGVAVWRGIRGAATEIALDEDEPVSIVSTWVIGGEGYIHEIQFSLADEPRVTGEKLIESRTGAYLFDTHAPSLGASAGVTEGGSISVAFKRAPGGSGGRSPSFMFPTDKSILSRRLAQKNVHQKVIAAAESLISEMSASLFLDLQPNLMRDFKSSKIKILGVNGENISSALFHICQDTETKIAVVDWISELCAPEVSDIDFVETEFDQVLFVLVESNGRRVSAKSVSDGTLRFLGELVALLTASRNTLLLIEELENGLHPSRQGLLVQAIEGYVQQTGIQVVASTHSPILLEALRPEVLQASIVFGRRVDEPGTMMRNIKNIDHFREVSEKLKISDMFTTLWLERAL